MRRTFTFALAASTAGILLTAACGGSSPTNSSGSGSSPTQTPTSVGVAVVAAASTKFGMILVDGRGDTLYAFAADKTTSSTCYSSCAQLWPAFLTSGPPTAGTGSDASKLATTRRTDGTTQVTYAGHPLYFYVSDKMPGDTTGQDVNSSGGLWHVLSPTGNIITTVG